LSVIFSRAIIRELSQRGLHEPIFLYAFQCIPLSDNQ
jgi:hypothetical protein